LPSTFWVLAKEENLKIQISLRKAQFEMQFYSNYTNSHDKLLTNFATKCLTTLVSIINLFLFIIRVHYCAMKNFSATDLNCILQ
jgi:hypothetical protein